MCRFKCRTFYIGTLRAKLILAPLGMPKCVWPSIQNFLLFKPPHHLLACTENFPNVKSAVCKTSNFRATVHWIKGYLYYLQANESFWLISTCAYTVALWGTQRAFGVRRFWWACRKVGIKPSPSSSESRISLIYQTNLSLAFILATTHSSINRPKSYNTSKPLT